MQSTFIHIPQFVSLIDRQANQESHGPPQSISSTLLWLSYCANPMKLTSFVISVGKDFKTPRPKGSSDQCRPLISDSLHSPDDHGN